MSTKKPKLTVRSNRRCGGRLFVLGANLLQLTGYTNDRLYHGGYFMVRSQVRTAVLEARMLATPCFFNGSRGATTFNIRCYEGTNIIEGIGCQKFTRREGRKLSEWASYGEIKIGKFQAPQV